MLVLTRKIDQTIVIGGGIVVRVLDAGGGRVRIGVEAPDDVVVLRGEIAARLGLEVSAHESAANAVPVC